MEYEKDYIKTYFIKAAAKKLPKAFKKAFRLKNPPEVEVYGLNVTNYIEELKTSGESKEKIKYTEWRAAFGALIQIKMDPPVEQLIYISDLKPVGEIEGHIHELIGILDFQIPKSIIYGRAAKDIKSWRAKKAFAPYPNPIPGLQEFFGGADVNLLELALTQKGNLFNIFEVVREGQAALDAMRSAYQLIESEQPTGDSLIDTLNSDKILMKYMNKIAHYGEAKASVMKGRTTITHYGKSATDISTICVPFKGKTIISLSNFNGNDRVSTAFAFKTLIEAFTGILGI